MFQCIIILRKRVYLSFLNTLKTPINSKGSYHLKYKIYNAGLCCTNSTVHILGEEPLLLWTERSEVRWFSHLPRKFTIINPIINIQPCPSPVQDHKALSNSRQYHRLDGTIINFCVILWGNNICAKILRAVSASWPHDPLAGNGSTWASPWVLSSYK